MKEYMVEYTLDDGVTMQTMIVNAKDYTTAYLDGIDKLPKEAIITELFEII